MSGQGPKFVNKQFNSPINLYSPQNVQETLEKQTQILSNGAVGIDFNQLAKPANLQNSAVLRMLEEEEARQRNGQPSLKRVAWPPPPEDQQFDYVEQTPVQAKTRGVGEYASYQGSPVSGSSPQPPTLQAAPQGLVQTSPSPLSPGGTLRQPLHFQQPAAVKGWAPVTPPASSPVPQQHQQQPSWQPQQQQKPAQAPWQQQPAQAPWQQPQQQQQQQTQQYPQHQAYQAAPQQQSYPVAPQQQQSQPVFAPASAPVFEPPPTTITLRPEPPISQEPSPVYQAQPAATRAPIPEFGNSNMRGDQKWPPATVKAQTEAENRARMELAKGPAFRPRRVPKDYSGFFAQHALNSTYPGYRTPPGTQYFTPRYQN